MILALSQIKEFISQNKFLELKEILAKAHYVDIAEQFEGLEDNEQIIIFRFLDKCNAIKLFEVLPFKSKCSILKNLKNTEISDILNATSPDKRVDFFKKLPQKTNDDFIGLMDVNEIADLKKLIVKEEGTAASLMTTKFTTLSPNMTLSAALAKLQESLKSEKCEQIYSNFVCDDKGVLLGVVDLQAWVKCSDNVLLKEIMTDAENIKLLEMNSDEIIASLFLKYKMMSLPVVDNENRLVGVIVFEDIIDIVQQKNTKDMHSFGKMHIEANEELKYSNSTSFDLVKRRASWFFFLLIFDFLTGTILKTYELALTRVVALSFFIPMILDSGGNAGTQTAVSVIKDLETGAASFKYFKKIAKKEIISALFMGFVVGIVCFIRAYLLERDFFVAFVVGISLFFIIMFAVLTGLFLPFLAKKIGLSPAFLAGPVTTTIIDIIGLVVYLNIAIRFLPALKGVF